MTMLSEPFAPWMRDLNRMFTPEGVSTGFIPPADVVVGPEGVSVFMDVPGVSAERLEIELENDVLTVQGERPYPYATEEGDQVVRRIERRFGRFERSLRVPRGLDPDAIQASLHDGVLTLRIPKPEELRPRRVTIRVEEEEVSGETPAGQPGQSAEAAPQGSPS